MNVLFVTITIILAFAAVVLATSMILQLIRDKKDQDAVDPILDKKTKNDLYELYMKMDPDTYRDRIDSLIDFHIAEYALYHFAPNDSYITGDMTEDMISDISKTVYINLSQLYVFYIQMIINVTTSEDVLGYIHNRTKTRVLLYITELNKPR